MLEGDPHATQRRLIERGRARQQLRSLQWMARRRGALFGREELERTVDLAGHRRLPHVVQECRDSQVGHGATVHLEEAAHADRDQADVHRMGVRVLVVAAEAREPHHHRLGGERTVHQGLHDALGVAQLHSPLQRGGREQRPGALNCSRVLLARGARRCRTTPRLRLLGHGHVLPASAVRRRVALGRGFFGLVPWGIELFAAGIFGRGVDRRQNVIRAVGEAGGQQLEALVELGLQEQAKELDQLDERHALLNAHSRDVPPLELFHHVAVEAQVLRVDRHPCAVQVQVVLERDQYRFAFLFQDRRQRLDQRFDLGGHDLVVGLVGAGDAHQCREAG